MPNCLLRVSISLANKRMFPIDKKVETHLLQFDVDQSFQQCLEASVAAFRKSSQSKKITPDEMAKVVCQVSDGDGAATQVSEDLLEISVSELCARMQTPIIVFMIPRSVLVGSVCIGKFHGELLAESVRSHQSRSIPRQG